MFEWCSRMRDVWCLESQDTFKRTSVSRFDFRGSEVRIQYSLKRNPEAYVQMNGLPSGFKYPNIRVLIMSA